MVKLLSRIILFIWLIGFGLTSIGFAGASVTLEKETWYIMGLTYQAGDQQEYIPFDPQAFNATYRLKGKREVTLIEIAINENGKLKKCACDNATYQWKVKNDIKISYSRETGNYVETSGLVNKKNVTIQCPCKDVVK